MQAAELLQYAQNVGNAASATGKTAVSRLNYEPGQGTLVVITLIILLLIFLQNNGGLQGLVNIAEGKDSTSGGGTAYSFYKAAVNPPAQQASTGSKSGVIGLPPFVPGSDNTQIVPYAPPLPGTEGTP